MADSISNLFQDFDAKLKEKRDRKSELQEDIDKNHLSFYEKIVNSTGLSRVGFTFLVFGAVFIMHLTATMIDYSWAFLDKVFEDFSVFLSLLIGIVTYILLVATRQLKVFTVNLIEISTLDADQSSAKYKQMLSDHFTGYRLLGYGIVFGLINTAIGYYFGIPYLSHLNKEPAIVLAISLALQFFVVGFISGLAVGGIVFVIKLVNSIDFKNEVQLNYFYPDRCAGTLIIGNILFNFAMYTIVVGLGIFIYIHFTDWIYKDDWLRKYLMIFWKIFPFLMAGLVFLYPVLKLNRHLRSYKYYEQLRVRQRLSYINELMLNMDSEKPENQEKMDLLNSHYDKLERVDLFIDQMNTWPYNLTHRTVFITAFLPVIVAVITELSLEVLSKLFFGSAE